MLSALGGVLLLCALTGPIQAQSATAASGRPPCSAPAFHQWDFWLGSWRVTDTSGALQGASAVTLAPSGCGFIEHWHGAKGEDGVSFNGYDEVRKSWTQFWVSPGAVIRLEGTGDTHGAIRTHGTISYGATGLEIPFRGNWILQPDGAVRQEFFQYNSKTKAWDSWFTGIYRHPEEPAQNPSCSEPEAHQFDFWIGKWDVYDRQSGERAGSSLIEQMYGGCVLRENWSEPGFAGGSLNIYSTADRSWHQTWTDQSGALREFVGGVVDGEMVMVAKTQSKKSPGREVLVRLKFTHNPDQTVRQHSEFSDDGGATWQERYDYLYRPVAAP